MYYIFQSQTKNKKGLITNMKKITFIEFLYS